MFSLVHDEVRSSPTRAAPVGHGLRGGAEACLAGAAVFLARRGLGVRVRVLHDDPPADVPSPPGDHSSES